MIVLNVDAADVAGFESGFIGNGADDVPRFYPVERTDLDPETLEFFFGTLWAVIKFTISIVKGSLLAVFRSFQPLKPLQEKPK